MILRDPRAHHRLHPKRAAAERLRGTGSLRGYELREDVGSFVEFQMLARKPQRTHAEFVSRHETVPATRVANVAKAPFADFFRHVAHASGMVWPIRLVSAEHVAKEGIMFKKVALTYYPVTDVTRARKFYEETLGLKRARPATRATTGG
jgi:hypothetical protein